MMRWRKHGGRRRGRAGLVRLYGSHRPPSGEPRVVGPITQVIARVLVITLLMTTPAAVIAAAITHPDHQEVYTSLFAPISR